MEVRIDAASPSIGRAVVGAVAPPWSCFAGMSDNGAGGNRFVEERHIDLVRVGPPELGIWVVRPAFRAAQDLETLTRNQLAPVAVVERSVVEPRGAMSVIWLPFPRTLSM